MPEDTHPHRSPSAAVPTRWQISSGPEPGSVLTLDRPRIMGILNTTPDSFHAGGRSLDPGIIATAAVQMRDDGADVIDIGGASTRPGAPAVDEATQIERTVPAIRAIRDAGVDLPISIDTTRASVAQAALDAGADAINDVSGGTDDPALLQFAARTGCGLILMHRLAAPKADAYADRYATEPDYSGGVVAAVRAALETARDRALAAGITPESLVLDPGLGFGKSVEQCVALHRATPTLLGLGHPVLGAVSRKSFVGRVALDRVSSPEERLVGTLAWTLAQFAVGIRLVRVHDVEEATQAARVWWRLGQTLVAAGFQHTPGTSGGDTMQSL